MNLREKQRLFTTGEYYQMAESGILSEEDHVELVEGQVVEMSPIGSRHAACVDRMNRLFTSVVNLDFIVRVQSPILLSEYSEPQPDLALLRPREDFYASGHPTPEDVLLVVEVSETSLDYDVEIKVPLYARARIPEIWIVDLSGGEIRTYSRPVGEGYQSIERLGCGGELASDGVPGLTVQTDDILM